MKKMIGAFLLILFILTGIGVGNTETLSPSEALEKAKEICKEYGILYDRALGPYLVLPQSSESEPEYLVYLTRDTMIVSECWIDGRSDDCGRLITSVADLLLDSAEGKERFKKEKGIEAIFIQLVFPIELLWGRRLMVQPVAWWIIDKKGDCYYVSLSGEIISFKKLAAIRKEPRKL